jgi:hypothetical protein
MDGNIIVSVMTHSCDNCNNCEILQKKVDIYERFFKEMKELEEEENKYKSFEALTESVYIEKDNDGNRNMKVKSHLSESFILIDKGKDLTELNKRDQNAINEQKNLHDYTVAKEYVEEANGIYSIVRFAFSIGKWLVL